MENATQTAETSCHRGCVWEAMEKEKGQMLSEEEREALPQGHPLQSFDSWSLGNSSHDFKYVDSQHSWVEVGPRQFGDAARGSHCTANTPRPGVVVHSLPSL